MNLNKDAKRNLTKQEHVANYIREFAAIESAMEPFKDQRRDLRESYSELGHLDKEEMRIAVKAYRLLKSDTDMDQLIEYFDKVKKTVGVIRGV